MVQERQGEISGRRSQRQVVWEFRKSNEIVHRLRCQHRRFGHVNGHWAKPRSQGPTWKVRSLIIVSLPSVILINWILFKVRRCQGYTGPSNCFSDLLGLSVLPFLQNDSCAVWVVTRCEHHWIHSPCAAGLCVTFIPIYYSATQTTLRPKFRLNVDSRHPFPPYLPTILVIRVIKATGSLFVCVRVCLCVFSPDNYVWKK